MTEITYQELRQKLGQPLVERHVTGIVGVRADNWPCECLRLVKMRLDAAYFHLYGIARHDVDYIMDTFPIVKRKDEAAHGEYRTKRVILEIYD